MHPIAVDCVPAPDRHAVVVLVRHDAPIGMDALLAALRNFCDEAEKKIAAMKLKNAILRPPGIGE